MFEDSASRILDNLPMRIGDIVQPWADRSPERPALVEAGGTWSYGQLASRISETQVWLLQSGVRPGDRVMIVCDNCRAFVAMLLAVAAIDAWPVLVSARLSGEEVDQIRDHCGARLAIYTTNASPHAVKHGKRNSAVVKEIAGLGPVGAGPLNGAAEPEPVDANASQRVAALIYTSGTTGVPKGVMLTHRNILFAATVAAKIRSLGPEDRMYGVLPMSHAAGLSAALISTLLSGGSLYLTPRFDPVAALASLERDRLTVLLGTPSLFSMLLDYARMKGLKSLKFPALRILNTAGAPLPAALKSEVENAFGLALHNAYGMTECSPNIAQTRVESPRRDTSVGDLIPGLEAKLVGLNGDRVADGGTGELWVRGPNIMRGYYRAPEETAAVLDAEGWFNTRDLARIEDGSLFLAGRTKELIIRFGLNVYPAEVEGVLNAHPAVVRSAVIGQPVEAADGGEEVVAFVQTMPGSSINAEDLAGHARLHLAPYKHPSEIVIVPSMPLTPTGKVIKEELVRMRTTRRLAS